MLSLSRFAALFALLLAAAPALAQDFLPTVPTGSIEVAVAPFAGGLGGSIGGVNQLFATKMVPFPDGSGRNLVSTLGGALRVVDSSGGFLDAPLGGPYLDMTTAQTDIFNGAYGTTTVAFHPDFANQGAAGFGKIYTILTEQERANLADYDFQPTLGSINDHTEVIAEFTVAPGAIASNRLLPGDVTRRDLLTIRQPDPEHNYGDLVFDENNLMYISAGDGIFDFNGGALYPEAQNAQDLSTPYGKILRIDPLGANSANGQYGVPAANVFASDGDANTLGEVFSYGHRNPFRLSYDEPTGRLFVGEVGQFNIEEVNISTNGANYGWPDLEGTFLLNPDNAFDLTLDADANNNGVGDFSEANGYVEPLFQYDHQDGISVTGGFVYRGSRLPALQGKYVFADLGGGGGGLPPGLFVGDPDTGDFERVNVTGGRGSLPTRLLSFGTDAAGEIYVMGTGGTIVTLIDPNDIPPPELFNGSFEENGGSLDGWVGFGAVAVTDEPTQDGEPLDGPNSARLSGQNNGGFNFNGLFQGLSIEGGERLRVDVSSLVRSLDSIVGNDATAEIKIEYYTAFGAEIFGPDFIRQEVVQLADGSSPEDVWVAATVEDIAPANAVEARVTLIFLQPDNGDTGSVHFDDLGFLVVEAGDYNADGVVDTADYDLWETTFGQSVSLAGLGADGNRDGVVDTADYTVWRDAAIAAGVAVPEPTTVAMAMMALLSPGGCKRSLKPKTGVLLRSSSP